MRKKLPPGQREIKKSRLRHIGSIPSFDLETWVLTAYGLVEKPLTLTWSNLLELPSVVIVSDFHCVEGWSVMNNKWEGVPFQTIVKMVKPEENARYVTFECEDGYTTSLPLTDLLGDDVLLAYKLEDEYLRPERGGPLRLIVPKKYAYKSAMWLKKIKFTSHHELGYWESRGYSNTADPWKQDRCAQSDNFVDEKRQGQ